MFYTIVRIDSHRFGRNCFIPPVQASLLNVSVVFLHPWLRILKQSHNSRIQCFEFFFFCFFFEIFRGKSQKKWTTCWLSLHVLPWISLSLACAPPLRLSETNAVASLRELGSSGPIKIAFYLNLPVCPHMSAHSGSFWQASKATSVFIWDETM